MSLQNVGDVIHIQATLLTSIGLDLEKWSTQNRFPYWTKSSFFCEIRHLLFMLFCAVQIEYIYIHIYIHQYTYTHVYIPMEPKWPKFWKIWPIKWTVNQPPKTEVNWVLGMSMKFHSFLGFRIRWHPWRYPNFQIKTSLTLEVTSFITWWILYINLCTCPHVLTYLRRYACSMI